MDFHNPCSSMLHIFRRTCYLLLYCISLEIRGISRHLTLQVHRYMNICMDVLYVWILGLSIADSLAGMYAFLCVYVFYVCMKVIAEAILSLSPEESDETFAKMYLPIVTEGNLRTWYPYRAYLPTRDNWEFHRHVKVGREGCVCMCVGTYGWACVLYAVCRDGWKRMCVVGTMWTLYVWIILFYDATSLHTVCRCRSSTTTSPPSSPRGRSVN